MQGTTKLYEDIRTLLRYRRGDHWRRVDQFHVRVSQQERLTATVFSGIWAKQADLSQRSVLIDILNRAGFDAPLLLDRASTDDITAKLDDETQAAAMRGVFGAPTMFICDQMFFGNDRLDFVVEALSATT